MCEPKTYPQIDEARFQGWKAAATKKGIEIKGETSGTLRWSAVAGTFAWNADSSELTVDLQFTTTARNCEIMYHDLGSMIPAGAPPAPASPPGPALSIDDAGRYTVIGQVLLTGNPLSEVRVQVWDADQVGPDDKLGQSYTDAQGYFTISFDPSSFNDWGMDRDPDLYFKIFDGEHMLGESSGNIIWNAKPGIEDIVIDLPKSSIPNE